MSGQQRQELALDMQSDDVDAAIARENQKDAKRIAAETAALQKLMRQAGVQIVTDGEKLEAAHGESEEAADTVKAAREELDKISKGLLNGVKKRIGNYNLRTTFGRTSGSLESNKKRFLQVIKGFMDQTDKSSVTPEQITAICLVGATLFSPAAQSEYRFGNESFSEDELKEALGLPHTHCHRFFTRFRVLCAKGIADNAPAAGARS